MTEWQSRKQFTTVLGHPMAHVEMGPETDAAPVLLFLHGNPTSSYLWRDVMAPLSDRFRCIAPDLIGMGDSAKLPEPGPQRYRFAEHAMFLDAWIDAVIPSGPIGLVIHDWGSALGFHWARRNADRVSGIAYMEGIVRPMAWDEWPDVVRDLFGALRSEAGEEMILEKNVFVERILPGSVLRDLSAEEMAEYRRPFAAPGEDRRPTLTWPRQIPLGGEPADVVEVVDTYAAWLATTPIPKLLIAADPGAILVGPMLETARSFANQTEVTVKGSHFIQEDSAADIADAIRDWADFGTD